MAVSIGVLIIAIYLLLLLLLLFLHILSCSYYDRCLGCRLFSTFYDDRVPIYNYGRIVRVPTTLTSNHIATSRIRTVSSQYDSTYAAHSRSISVSVIEVPDGDGVKVFDRNAKEILNVRLIGIDAPEMKGRQPFAVEAKRHLERLVLRKTAILTKYSTDQYGRLLGSLRVQGKVDNVSLEMLKAGFACVYTGKCAEFGGMRAEFYRAERLAKASKKGMWALNDVMLPMKYKRLQRNRSSL